MKSPVLIVEDNDDLREEIYHLLISESIECVAVSNGMDALSYVTQNEVSLILSDVNMSPMNGLELLVHVKRLFQPIPFLLLTAFSSVEKAVAAMKLGAVDYLTKPLNSKELIEKIKTYQVDDLSIENKDVIASDGESIKMFNLAKKIASSHSSILILGESGTGKEVLARFIHENSNRKNKPFIAINCAAIPENMIESTLFGFEKGAFTGAYAASAGKFEQANEGTLLLDEISEMPLNLQAKLLRVLQEKEVERIGGKKIIQLDVRVLATSNRNLIEEVKCGRFREDLYYRLNVFSLTWKPLRERKKDILPIAEALLIKHAKSSSKSVPILSDEVKLALQGHLWPGNIRELENVMQRLLILSEGKPVAQPEDLCFDLINHNDSNKKTALDFFDDEIDDDIEHESKPLEEDESHYSLNFDLQKHEFELISKTLNEVNGSRKNAAIKLGISPRTLRYKLAKMREYGLLVEA